MSYGTKAVGLDFNPSSQENVTRVKTLLAEAMDIVVDEGKGFNQLALDTLLLAQMAAVKSLTWSE